MSSPVDRLKRVHRKIAEKAAKAQIDRQAVTQITTAALLETAKARASDVLGAAAPIPAPLNAITRREERDRLRDEVVRLSKEGLSVTEITVRTGLKYGHVAKIRHDRQVNPRKPRNP